MTSLRWAPLHFALLGALLFAGERALDGARVDALAASGVASAADYEVLLLAEGRRLALDRWDPVVRRRLVRNMRFALPDSPLSDAALYERALELGLDASDPVVQRRIVDRARRHLAAEAPLAPPGDAELAAFLARHPERFAVPERLRIRQIFVADATRAGRLARTLAAGEADPDAASRHADPFAYDVALPLLSLREIAGRLGPDFALRVSGLPVGRWSGPVASAYGFHVVLVEDRRPARAPRLEEVRQAVRRAWLEARRARAVRRALDAIAARRGGPDTRPPG